MTYAALREGLPSAAGGGHDAADGPALDAELRSAARMCAGGVRPTSDPLGIGGLLVDAARVAQLGARGAMSGLLGPWQDLVAVLLHSARLGLEAWLRAGGQDAAPWERRLTFRELGVAIGLEALDRVDAAVRGRGAHAAADELGRLRASAPVGRRIVDHWRRRRTEHGAPDVLRDIDEVMLATALSPGGYLDLLPPAS